jgi:hypoxanthine phosphoribosyltransferase
MIIAIKEFSAMWEEKDIKKVLVSEEQIRTRADELGKQITADYQNNPPLLVALLRGSVPFLAELIKHIDLDIQYDFMDVSSYEGTESIGDIRIEKDLDTSVKGLDILLVEDIVDTGRTIDTVQKMLLHKGARSVEVVTLLDKPSRRINDLKPKYAGFEVENEFVVGFGMDFDQKYRCLPYIGVLNDECYESKE